LIGVSNHREALLPKSVGISSLANKDYIKLHNRLSGESMVKKSAFGGSGKTVAKLKEKKQKEEKSVAASHQPMIIAMVWYKEEHYEELLALFDDTELLPKTYSDWLIRADEKKVEVEATGDQVIKVFIDPETFPEWCEKKNLPKDANSRSLLALEVAQAQSFSL
jgi:hypothetical protein